MAVVKNNILGMSEKNRGENPGRIKPEEEKKEIKGLREIADLKNSPWQDLTEDLEVLSNPSEINNPERQVFVNNQDAAYAVEQGFLIVNKTGADRFRAFTTDKWEEEKNKRKVENSAMQTRKNVGVNGLDSHASRLAVTEEKKPGKKEKIDEEQLKILLREYGLQDMFNLRRQNRHYVLTLFRKNQTVRDTITGSIGEIADEIEHKYGTN